MSMRVFDFMYMNNLQRDAVAKCVGLLTCLVEESVGYELDNVNQFLAWCFGRKFMAESPSNTNFYG